jgi:hypothetical protein
VPAASLSRRPEAARHDPSATSWQQNERFRDLVDLLLMDAMITQYYGSLREACELVFRNRNTHPWPPDLSTVPAHWAPPFARLAEELELAETDVEAALVRVRDLVARILGDGVVAH